MPNTAPAFQCFTCQAVTRHGGFNEYDRWECRYCFEDRQRTAKRPAGGRKGPVLYMNKHWMADDEIVMDALSQHLRGKK